MPCMGPIPNEVFAAKFGDYLFQFNFVLDNGHIGVFLLNRKISEFFRDYYKDWKPNVIWSAEAIQRNIGNTINEWFYTIYGFLYLTCGDDGTAKPGMYTLDELRDYIKAVDYADACISF